MTPCVIQTPIIYGETVTSNNVCWWNKLIFSTALSVPCSVHGSIEDYMLKRPHPQQTHWLFCSAYTNTWRIWLNSKFNNKTARTQPTLKLVQWMLFFTKSFLCDMSTIIHFFYRVLKIKRLQFRLKWRNTDDQTQGRYECGMQRKTRPTVDPT